MPCSTQGLCPSGPLGGAPLLGAVIVRPRWELAIKTIQMSTFFKVPRAGVHNSVQNRDKTKSREAAGN